MGKYRRARWRKLVLWVGIIVFLALLLLLGGQAVHGAASTILTVAAQLLFSMLIVVGQFAALFWFLARGRTYWILPGETGFSWKDYRGNPEIVANAKRIVTLLKGVSEFKEMGGESIRGMLLCGPPGTGKSYLAQVIANEAQVPFAYASAPSFQRSEAGVPYF